MIIWSLTLYLTHINIGSLLCLVNKDDPKTDKYGTFWEGEIKRSSEKIENKEGDGGEWKVRGKGRWKEGRRTGRNGVVELREGQIYCSA